MKVELNPIIFLGTQDIESNSSLSFGKTSASCSDQSQLKFKNVHLVSNSDLPGSGFQTLVLVSYLVFEFLFSAYYLFFVEAFTIQTLSGFIFEYDRIFRVS